MAFVKEIIETDEQKAFFDSFGFNNYQGEILHSRKKATKWYVDKVNNIFLFSMGGGSFEIPNMYGIQTLQGLIVIESQAPHRYSNDDIQNGVTKVHWSIEKISYPKTIKFSETEVKNIVISAISAMESTDSDENQKYVAIFDNISTPVKYGEWEEKYYAVNR